MICQTGVPFLGHPVVLKTNPPPIGTHNFDHPLPLELSYEKYVHRPGKKLPSTPQVNFWKSPNINVIQQKFNHFTDAIGSVFVVTI